MHPTVTPVHDNPPRRKWTYEEAASKKDQAERFERDVLEDDSRADDFAAMSPEEYAAARGVEIIKGDKDEMHRKNAAASTKNADLKTNPVALATEANKVATKALDKQRELEEEVRDLKSQIDQIADILEDDELSASEKIAEIHPVVFDETDEDEDDEEDQGKK